MLTYTLDDYRDAPGGVGPLSYQWEDKPHRLLYDLVDELKLMRENFHELSKAVTREGYVIDYLCPFCNFAGTDYGYMVKHANSCYYRPKENKEVDDNGEQTS